MHLNMFLQKGHASVADVLPELLSSSCPLAGSTMQLGGHFRQSTLPKLFRLNTTKLQLRDTCNSLHLRGWR